MSDTHAVKRSIRGRSLNGYVRKPLLECAFQIVRCLLAGECADLDHECGRWSGWWRRSGHFPGLENLQLDGRDPRLNKIDLARGAQGEIDNASVDEGATIVDSDIDPAPIAFVCNSNERVER